VLKRLSAFLRGERTQPDLGTVLAEIASLRASVRALDEQQVRRELEWAEIAEKLKRYLQRITTVEQRAQQREAKTHEADPVTAAVLRLKYTPKQSGG
jgi:hypothetical protein